MVHRRDHHDIQVADVIPLVMPYGEVSVVERLRPDIAELMDMPNAIYVEFAVFDSDRDIVSVSTACYRIPGLSRFRC